MTFLVLDGIDGCGKSTQAGMLAGRLRDSGRVVHHLREPGSTPVGEALRQLLLDPDVCLGPEVETLLFAASRRQLLDSVVAPALARGEVVVCERHNSSTFAYQAIAGQLDPSRVVSLLDHWCSSVCPDRVLILEVDPAKALARRAHEQEDRIEARGLEFQVRVAEGYRRFVAQHESATSIDGDADPLVVADLIWREVEGAL